MDGGDILIWLVVGAIAGWLAATGFVRSVISAFIGACLLLTVLRLVKRS